MRTSIFGAILTASMTMSGCATLLASKEQSIRVSSTPSEAEISVDGVPFGKTPNTLFVDGRHDHLVEISKAGYERRGSLVTSSAEGGWVVLDILCGLLPVVVDASTRAWFSMDVTSISAVLEPVGLGVTKSVAPPKSEPATANVHMNLKLNEETEVFDGRSTLTVKAVASGKASLTFRGIFGLSREQRGPFDGTTIVAKTGEAFYVQVTTTQTFKVEVLHIYDSEASISLSQLGSSK